jgi:hypothetical protein
VLLDKEQRLSGAAFAPQKPGQAVQVEMLRRLIYWFWHDLSHFITAMARGQLFWAYGQLETLRNYDVNLLRLKQDFMDTDVGPEGYFKVEQALSAEQLEPLRATYCAQEPDAMLTSGFALLRLYGELAPPLARTHGIVYPEALERVMVERLEDLSGRRLRG